MKKLIITGLVAVAIAGCNQKEMSNLEQQTLEMQAELDSLTIENEKNIKAMGILNQVTVYMDSIDVNRKIIQTEIEQGMAQEDLVDRMAKINDYVKKAEKMIANLEGTRSAYALQVKRLKAEVEAANKNIQILQGALEAAKTENTQLVTVVEMQEGEIAAKTLEIASKKEELNLIEQKIQQLMIKANMTEAEAYFARGEAVEEAANRTKLAAKKKNETLKEALALYQKSHDMGYDKASAKVQELKIKIKG